MRGESTIGQHLEVGSNELLPASLIMRPERSHPAAQPVGSLFILCKNGHRTNISRDRRKPGPLELGADIIENHPTDGMTRQCGIGHANQSAHGGADPIHGLDPEPCDESYTIRNVLRDRIEHRLSHPIRIAATNHIRAHNPPPATGHRAGQGIEIGCSTCQTMNTDNDPSGLFGPRRCVEPFPISNLV